MTNRKGRVAVMTAKKPKARAAKAKVTAEPTSTRTRRREAQRVIESQPHVIDLTDEPEEQKPAEDKAPERSTPTDSADMEASDYFEVLGLTRAASDADVKRAYRKLAVRWHPDKNRGDPCAEENFKKVSEAYEVLSDRNKRAVYEQYGKAGLEHGSAPPRDAHDRADVPHAHFGFAGGRPGFSTQHARDIFDTFFGGADPFEAFFGGGRQSSSSAKHRGRHARGGFQVEFGDSPFESMGFGGFGHGMGIGGKTMMDSFFDQGGFEAMGSNGGFSTSTSSSSSTFTDRDGHLVTQKTTTTTGPDGQSETITEEFRDGNLVSSTSASSSSQLASAGRMQLEGASRSGSQRRQRQRY